MRDSSQYNEIDDGEEVEDADGNITTKGPIGVAILALDQLTLGVPGTVQVFVSQSVRGARFALLLLYIQIYMYSTKFTFYILHVFMYYY
jgi:hypothetical protein